MSASRKTTPRTRTDKKKSTPPTNLEKATPCTDDAKSTQRTTNVNSTSRTNAKSTPRTENAKPLSRTDNAKPTPRTDNAKPTTTPHADDAKSTTTQATICKYYSKGSCRFGKECEYLHPEICWHFNQGSCKFGSACRNFHPEAVPETVPKDAPTPSTTKDCWFWVQNGCCRNGEKCQFNHPPSDCSPPILPSIDTKPASKRSNTTSADEIDHNTKFDWKGKNGHKKILVIGGAGHGKSTFINSVHNYFNKKSLSEMEVVIPTKYLQPIEDSPCDTENPNPMNSTDSVTQRCTEYTFLKPFSRNASITFIDTPGLTDGTRCSAQDKISMDKILQHISESEHDEPITGIIMIMKGNQNKDISSMQTIAQKLKSIMTQNIIDNIVTVFTNCRFKSSCDAHSHIPFSIKRGHDFYIDNLFFFVDVAAGLDLNRKKRAYEESWNETMDEIGENKEYTNKMKTPRKGYNATAVSTATATVTATMAMNEEDMAQPVSITTPTTFAPSPSNKDSFHSTTPSISSSSPSPSSSAETVKKDHMKLPNKDLKNKDIITMDNNNHHLGESFKHLTTNVRLKEAIDQILTDSIPEQLSYEYKELLINN
eukprot:gene13176-27866_t